MRKVEIQRRWGGWPMSLVRLLAVLVCWVPIPVAIGFAVALLGMTNELPPVPDLSTLRPTYPSRVTSAEGWHLAGADVTREVPYHELPPHVVGAFLAAEDEDFFVHSAFSLRGILRAALANVRLGRSTQGASTITQQVARQFLTTDKTYKRKIKELLLARRLEAVYRKDQILATYLSSVFLGHTAHGVTQASWYYFNKPPTKLTEGEAATLAGILPSPSRYSPFVSLEAAKRERDRVLRRMTETGMIDEATADRARGTDVVVGARDDRLKERLPRAAQGGIRFAANWGKEAWGAGGMQIVMPHEPVHQAKARAALKRGIVALDRRQGWRGPAGKARDPARLDPLLVAQPEGQYALGRVDAVETKAATVITRGGPVSLTLATNSWAEPAATPRHFRKPVTLSSLQKILAVDDVVVLDLTEPEPQLFQIPAYEGATLSVDTATGGVRAAVGGFDADGDEFDRVFQGCRQPGSVFKPVVYAQAIASGLTAATMLSDVPVELATGRGGVWRPRNADKDFKGYVTLANALAWSRNIPTVNLMEFLGMRNVVARGKSLGIASHIDATSSASLGASCVKPAEIISVFGAFQRRGHVLGVSEISYWIDRDGAVRDDSVHFAEPGWSASARLSRMSTVAPLPTRGVSENVAYVMLSLLRRVVTSGTAHDLDDDWLVAGKTGTTNKYDAWFVGFDGRLTSITWVGSDKNTHALGRGEHGATVALPVFASYFDSWVSRKQDDDDDYPGPPPPGVEFLPIDAETGLRAPPGEWGAQYPFIVGTAPTDVSPTRGTKQAQRIEELIYEF